MPVIQQYDPLSAAADAMGSFLAQKRQNTLNDQAKAYQQQRDTVADQAQNRTFQQQDRAFQANQQQNQVVNAREQARLELEAKRDASEQLHQAREDALKAAQEHHAETQDNRAFALEVRKIDEQYRLGVAKVQATRDAAQIHAAATVASANIRAAASVQAAGISASSRLGAARISSEGADKRQNERLKQAKQFFTQRDLTTRRGQDLTATSRANTVNAADQRAIMAAAAVMARSKNAPKAPTPAEDPHFTAAIQQFMHDSPEDRQAFLDNPNVPAKTKAYFQGLSAFLGAEPEPVSPPDLGGDDEEETP